MVQFRWWTKSDGRGEERGAQKMCNFNALFLITNREGRNNENFTCKTWESDTFRFAALISRWLRFRLEFRRRFHAWFRLSEMSRRLMASRNERKPIK